MNVDSGDIHELVDVNPDDEGDRRGWTMAYNFYASPSPDGAHIAYSTCQYDDSGGLSEDAGPRGKFGYEIAIVDIDGTEQQRLTRNRDFDHLPSWSPDGDKIAYLTSHGFRDPYGYDSVKTSIRIINDPLETAQWIVIKHELLALYPPIWSPDSQRLAFAVLNPDYSTHWHDIYAVKADGEGLQKLGVASTLPTWSSDGERIAFAMSTDVDSTLYTVRYDGTDLREIWPNGTMDQQEVIKRVDWSPDGSEILVVSHLSSGNSRLWAISPDGSERRTVGKSEYSLQLVDAIWSPDGSRIAVRLSSDPVEPRVYFDDEDLTIFTLSRDGTDPYVMVRAHWSEFFNSKDPENPYPVKPPSVPDSIEQANCTFGAVVPDPEHNPGLIHDCEILLAVRDRLAGRGSLNWTSNIPILDWEGVKVSGTPSRVHELVLPNSRLTGTIPPELGQLAELKQLSLYSSSYRIPPNILTGPIPPELANLSKLEGLGLSGNFLSGNIPDSLSHLEHLRSLSISGNFLSGCIPEGLRELEHHDFEDTVLEFCSGVDANSQ